MSGTVRLAVLGDPLAYTLSPVLHQAGLAALGIPCHSEALRTVPATLCDQLQALAGAGYLGVNLTHPLKEAALACLERVTDSARRARSVNTVGFESRGWWGESTDGPGFLDLLEHLGRAGRLERVHLLGAGGAARSLAGALAAAGAEVTVSARDTGRAERAWEGGAAVEFAVWRSPAERRALARSAVIVNCTPLQAEAEAPAPLDEVPRGALLVDLVYGRSLTPWVARGRALGFEAHDGLGLLVFQARRSLQLWTGREVPLEPLTRAVGWPR